jgi:acyl carrier protein phosphodiesterase
MINAHSPELKALTPAQRAKARKLITQYEAERHPIMCTAQKLDEANRRQAYIDLDCEARIEKLEAQHAPRIELLKQAIIKLNTEMQELQDTIREERSEIRSEPYRVADADPKSQAIREIWQTLNESYDAKMTALLESFKSAEVSL